MGIKMLFKHCSLKTLEVTNLSGRIAELPLHSGKAPQWLVSRMIKLSKAIVKLLIEEYGKEEFLRRIADPYWFQAFGCVLGYDWHSSGVTTVVTGVLKTALEQEDLGIAICGGKGKKALATPLEIEIISEKYGFSESKIRELKRASFLAAKVDNSALQDGYSLYHHAIFITEDGSWSVVQQGMNPETKYARRYHWLKEDLRSFVVEPHKAIVGKKERAVLNMVAKESEEVRNISVDLVREDPRKLASLFSRISGWETLDTWIGTHIGYRVRNISKYLRMPWRVNWRALKEAYEMQPTNYEELISIKGLGPSTIRALALISSLVYGKEPSWKDPVKYSFAFGGKDGVPFPVRIKDMDRAIELLEESIKMAEIGEREKLKALKRLGILIEKR